MLFGNDLFPPWEFKLLCVSTFKVHQKPVYSRQVLSPRPWLTFSNFAIQLKAVPFAECNDGFQFLPDQLYFKSKIGKSRTSLYNLDASIEHTSLTSCACSASDIMCHLLWCCTSSMSKNLHIPLAWSSWVACLLSLAVDRYLVKVCHIQPTWWQFLWPSCPLDTIPFGLWKRAMNKCTVYSEFWQVILPACFVFLHAQLQLTLFTGSQYSFSYINQQILSLLNQCSYHYWAYCCTPHCWFNDSTAPDQYWTN